MINQNTILGMPRKIVWGYIGILVFMMGDGLEIGWLSPYLQHNGFNSHEVSWLFSCYGITVAIASWFSGVLAEARKRTMFIGLILYVIELSLRRYCPTIRKFSNYVSSLCIKRTRLSAIRLFFLSLDFLSF